jgi:hypothetical protein
MKLVDTNDPFYRPLWKRAGIVAVTGIWAAVEVYHGVASFWALLAVALFIFCAWTFLITWKSNP